MRCDIAFSLMKSGFATTTDLVDLATSESWPTREIWSVGSRILVDHALVAPTGCLKPLSHLKKNQNSAAIWVTFLVNEPYNTKLETGYSIFNFTITAHLSICTRTLRLLAWSPWSPWSATRSGTRQKSQLSNSGRLHGRCEPCSDPIMSNGPNSFLF